MDDFFDLTKVKWVKGHHDLPEAHYIFHVPSVSTILSEVPDPELEAFIQNIGKEKADEIMKLAAFRGSATHIFIQQFIIKYSQNKDISEALKYTQEESPRLLEREQVPQNKIEEGRNLFYKFYYSDYSNRYLDVLAIELMIYSPLYYYRGKLDILYKDKLFGLSITDFKSASEKIKKDSAKEYKMKLQLGAYANAIEEMYKEKNIIVNNANILCINKRDDVIQEIMCSGTELQKMKDEFKTLVKSWHIKYNQQFLIQ
jgi:hypothetical protein